MSSTLDSRLPVRRAVGETGQAAPRDAGRGPLGVGLVSVIVPHLNDYDNLDICLRLLQTQSFPADRTEIIVADNGSSWGFDAVCRLVGSRARVIEVADRGAGLARNAAVRVSQGEALAFIDSDCRPDKQWLEEGLAELRHADIAGGRIDVLVENPQRMTSAEAFESVFAFRNERYVRELKFTVTASMFVRRSVFEAVGDFANGVPEDMDWCERAGRLGYSIRFAPNSIVGHPARRTMVELKRKWRRLAIESCEGARRKGTAPGLVLLRHGAALLAVLPHAIRPLGSRRLPGMRNRLMAIVGLAQIRAYRLSIAYQAVVRQDENACPEARPSREPDLGVLLYFTLPATGKGVSYTLRSIGRELSGLHNHVEAIAPYGSAKRAENYRVTYTHPNVLRLIPTSKARYLLQRRLPVVGRAILRRNETIFIERARQAAASGPTIAYLWPGYSELLLHRLQEAGIPIVSEMINCHRGTAKNLLDAEYARLGLRPSHNITEKAVTEETNSLLLSDYIFCSNPHVEKSLVDHGISQGKIIPVSFGWDPHRLRGERQMMKRISGTTFLFVGSICIRKGAHLLMRYWAKSGIKGRLVMVGRMEPAIKQICQEYVRRDDIVIANYAAEIGAYYQSSDVFVFPSLEEGGPMVTYEAAGSALPLLVSPMGAARIADETTGVVLDPNDEEAWIQTMRRLDKDVELRRRLGSAAQRKAAQFVWSEVSKTRSVAFQGIVAAGVRH